MSSDDDALRKTERSAETPATPRGAEVPAVPDSEPVDAPAGGPRLPDAYDEVRHTRSGALWSSLVAGAVVLLLLLVFIVQNLDSQRITLLFWEADLPIGVSLLIAAILGALLVGLAGGLRILQLRRAAKKLR